MNSKDLLEKVDFEEFIKTGNIDCQTAIVLKKVKLPKGRFPLPPGVNSYSDQEKDSMQSIIKFRAENLTAQGRILNGSDICLQSLSDTVSIDRRSWVTLKVEDYLLIFIINSKTFDIDGCMSLKITSDA
ncbi:hypothetical protein [Pseudomonas sp. LP_7_YM]|uniref:hypothetical protein n=1 Tax=Pseudomonas sp. LP_7_YM TaxID=2485137 RepID=UPI00105F02D7|nr:hypothetical protein [Pseudomonas sp. LP_7_YM]